MTEVSNEKIPNNVGLSNDRKLQRALERWLPNYLDWWRDMGPEGFQEKDVFLRTAVSVERDGWANFDYVRMPDYRWGIFLADAEPERTVGFGDHRDEPAWQQVPGEYRNMLRRIIVTQGDTEPASVEQQRFLGQTAPSLYDMRNLFQVNVEEGRHLWAMVYLLHSYFGRDGREEAEELLARRSGDEDKPRILGAFNAPMTDWLQFFMFTTFTDKDGKYQLLSLAESGFDPLARTCKFMLTEEAHHMFVGETGVGRVIERTCELMKTAPSEDVTKVGGVPLDMIQRALNYWFSLSLDLFGGEISSNAASYFASGIKGRAWESKKTDDHRLLDLERQVAVIRDGALRDETVNLRNALNEVLRDDYVADNERTIERWNRIIENHGIDFELRLPSRRFNRQIGEYSGHRFNPDGQLIDAATFEAHRDAWLVSDADRAYIASIQTQVVERGKMANWIAAPAPASKGDPSTTNTCACRRRAGVDAGGLQAPALAPARDDRGRIARRRSAPAPPPLRSVLRTSPPRRDRGLSNPITRRRRVRDSIAATFSRSRSINRPTRAPLPNAQRLAARRKGHDCGRLIALGTLRLDRRGRARANKFSFAPVRASLSDGHGGYERPSSVVRPGGDSRGRARRGRRIRYPSGGSRRSGPNPGGGQLRPRNHHGPADHGSDQQRPPICLAQAVPQSSGHRDPSADQPERPRTTDHGASAPQPLRPQQPVRTKCRIAATGDRAKSEPPE